SRYLSIQANAPAPCDPPGVKPIGCLSQLIAPQNLTEGKRVMNKVENQTENPEFSLSLASRALGRRAFLGRMAAGAALLAPGTALFADPRGRSMDQGNQGITEGDAALLRFAAAAEILETDFWVQYNELGGIQDVEEPDGSGNPLYTNALKQLDGD